MCHRVAVIEGLEVFHQSGCHQQPVSGQRAPGQHRCHLQRQPQHGLSGLATARDRFETVTGDKVEAPCQSRARRHLTMGDDHTVGEPGLAFAGGDECGAADDGSTFTTDHETPRDGPRRRNHESGFLPARHLLDVARRKPVIARDRDPQDVGTGDEIMDEGIDDTRLDAGENAKRCHDADDCGHVAERHDPVVPEVGNGKADKDHRRRSTRLTQ